LLSRRRVEVGRAGNCLQDVQTDKLAEPARGLATLAASDHVATNDPTPAF
jgi:hypothetical protein